MTVSSVELKTATVSDIHLGHPRTETALIAQNLKDAFPYNAETAMLDVIFFAGDVFDSLLSLPQDEVALIDDVILYFLRLCKHYNILFVVLEGTPSHDRGQSKRFEILNKTHKVGCNLHYVDDLEIRYFEEINSHILFVPDEWGTAEKTLQAVHGLLQAHGLSKVDYAVMHGQFEHQLPEFVPAQKHILSEYLAIVDKLIWIGHVHIFSQKERCIAQGSFDRLSQNEEHAKGHVRCTIRSRDDWEVKFVENKNAKSFVTIDCKGLELADSIKKVEEAIVDLRDKSYVRVSAEANNPILQSIKHYETLYSNLNWDAHQKVDKVNKSQAKSILEEKLFVPVQITPSNIARLVEDRIKIISKDAELNELARTKILELI